MSKTKKLTAIILALTMLFGIITIAPFTVSAADNYALTYLVGVYDVFTDTAGNMSATINGTEYYYSDDYGEYDDISDNFSSMENQNVLYELHNSKIARVYSMDNVLVPTITVEPGVKEGLTYRNGKFSQSSFDLAVKVSVQPKSVFQENDISWFLSSDEQKECLYLTLKNLEIEPSGGVDFGSSGWWLWKDYQTKISENINDKIKMGETKEYHYTVNLQDGKALNQKEYNIELYTTPTFDFGTVDRTTSKIKVGNLDYQEERTEEKKATSTSGKTVTQASNKLAGVESALQFSNNLLTSDQTEQINEYVNLWISELILAKYVDKTDLKQTVTEDIANEWLSKLGLDTSVLLVPGTIQATTYLKTQTKDGTKIFIEFYINMMDFDFGNSGMPTMATGSGTATIYNMDGEKLDSSVILPAYADICAFCEQLQSVAKNTIFNGAKQYRTIFGIDTDATAEALSSQLMTKLLNNKYTKDIFKKVDAKDVKTALKKIISEGDKKCGNKIFELVTTPSQDSTLISVKCPVDVTVYDNDGNICGMVRNNVVDTSYSDVYINVVGDQKNIYLIGDDYTFTMSGTDSGTMDYVVTEFDESGNKTREITYSDIELTDGCQYYSYVPEAENHNSCLFDLTDSEGNVISATTGGESDTYITESSGKCGDDVYWTLYSDGTLYIYGRGKMFNYNNTNYKTNKTPWYNYWENIKNVTVGSGVTSIGSYAFDKCTSLKSITIPDSVTYISDRAFSECTNLTNVTMGNGVTEIGMYAFNNCTNLTSITIPDSVTVFRCYEFSGCTSLREINVDSNNMKYSSANGVLYNKDKTELRRYPQGKTESSFSVPNSVTEIGEWAFEDCTNLASITIPDRVTFINSYAFKNCTSLASITIPDSVTSIADWAFEDCTSLASITIPDRVTFINTYAFKNCTSLESITIPDSVRSIGTGAFEDCTSLESITIPDSVRSIGIGAFEDCTSLTSITIPDGVKKIYNKTFYGCTSLTNITIPDSVTSIGVGAFSGTAWYNNQPDGVVYAGKVVYDYKGEMPEDTSIVLEDGTLGIADFAFWGYDNLTNIAIPDSVTSIGEYAFKNCTSLKSVTIPSNVTEIRNQALGYYTDENGNDVKTEDFTISGYTGTAAETYANENGFDFVSLGNIIKDNKTDISVTISKDAELSVEKLTDSESAKDVITVLGKAEKLVDLYDISLTKNGEAVQPDELATVKIPCNNENAKVYRIEEDGSVTDMNAVYEDGYMVFATDHFSLYVLVVPNDNLVGDANGDGEVNAKDRMMLTRYLAKWTGYESIDKTAADVNNDGDVNAKDRMILTRHLAKWQGYETLPLNK